MNENLRIALQVLAVIVLLTFGYIAGYQDGGYPRRKANRERGARRG